MFLKQGFFRRGGIILVGLLTGLGARADPSAEKSLNRVLEFQEESQQLLQKAFHFLEPGGLNLKQIPAKYPVAYTVDGHRVVIDWADVPKDAALNTYWDHIATVWKTADDGTERKMLEVLWNFKKTGALPDPEDSLIRASFEENGVFKNFVARQEELLINGTTYYKTRLQFAHTSGDGKPLERGNVEIFQDVPGQLVKISSSLIEGPSDMLPAQMKQRNIRGVISFSGHVFLIEEATDPLHVADDQSHSCKSPRQTWVEKNSREWDEHCAPLLDTKLWHGYAFSEIPMSYKPFFKN